MVALDCLIYYVLILCAQFINTNSGTINTNRDKQYKNETIHCTANEACHILCSNVDGCASSQIYCPSNYPCDITCDANTACANTIIYAQTASSFRLLDCATGSFTCKGITIYFPPNNNGIPRAKIIGADEGLSAGENLTRPLQFYAMYGWDDINITTGHEFAFDFHSGVMHCTANLQTSCAFASDAWKCQNEHDLCNNPPTPSPSPISIVTTQTETTQDIKENENEQIGAVVATQRQAKPIITSTTLYVIIAMLLAFLCCFGSILLYYMYYSQAYAQKLAEIHQPSLSMKSGVPSHSTLSAMTSPVTSNSTMITSLPSISPNSRIRANNVTHTENNIIRNIEMMPIKNKIATNRNICDSDNMSSDDAESQNNNMNAISNRQTHVHQNTKHTNQPVQNTHSPWVYFANNYNHNNACHTHTNMTNKSIPNPMVQPIQIQEHYLRQLIAAQQHIQLQTNNNNNNMYEIPSQSLLTSSISSNPNHSQQQQQILYQQPSQHHMLQMMSMMNQSQPPSLSSFINQNQQQARPVPIPPSVSNTPNTSSNYLQPRKVTITSSIKDEHANEECLKIPPPESLLSGLTSITATTEPSQNSQSDDSDIVDNIYTIQ